MLERWCILIGIAVLACRPGTIAGIAALLIIIPILLRVPPRRGPVPVLLVILLAWQVLSFTWSMSPGETLLIAARNALIAWAAYLFARRMRMHDATHLMSIGLSLVGWAALLMALVAPSVALDRERLLMGPTTHPNNLGYMMAAGFLLAVLGGWKGASGHTARRLAALVCLVCLVLSGAMTSIVALAVAIFVAALMALLRAIRAQTRAIGVPLAAMAVSIVAAWVATHLDDIFKALGRDPTLTGRTDIWREVWALIELRPVLGYGLGAPWVDHAWTGDQLFERLTFWLRIAHQGYLDAWLQLGIIGLALFVAIIVVSLLRWIPPALRPVGGTSLGLALIVYEIILNTAETSFTFYSGWMVLCYAYCAATAEPIPAHSKETP